MMLGNRYSPRKPSERRLPPPMASLSIFSGTSSALFPIKRRHDKSSSRAVIPNSATAVPKTEHYPVRRRSLIYKNGQDFDMDWHTAVAIVVLLAVLVLLVILLRLALLRPARHTNTMTRSTTGRTAPGARSDRPRLAEIPRS